MAEHSWTVLCQRVLIDQDSKLLSFVDVFDRLIISPSPEMPDIAARVEELRKEGQRGILVPTELRVVSQWYRTNPEEPESAKCRISLKDTRGDDIFAQEVSIELTEKPLQRITVQSHEIGITGLGLHWIVVEKPKRGKGDKWAEVTRIPLHIVAAGT